VNDVRLVWKEDGFDLAYSQFPCADEPVVVVHADATIEFWPAERIEPTCEAAEAFHLLSVKWKTDIPFEDWEFIYYPPKLPIP